MRKEKSMINIKKSLIIIPLTSCILYANAENEFASIKSTFDTFMKVFANPHSR